MEFKIPPGNLSWLSALWIFLGGYFGFTCFQNGDSALGGAFMLFVVAGILMWLDVRAIAWPLIVWFGLVMLMGLLVLVIRGFSMRMTLKVLMAAYTMYDLYAWRYSE